VAEQVDPYQAPRAELDGPTAADRTSAPASEAVTSLLAQTRPWVKLMAVLAFVANALILLAVVGVVLRGGDTMKASALVPMLFLSLLYVPPAVFLWSYAGGIAELQRGGGQNALEKALRSQKSFWKYVAILSCVLLALYAIGIAAVVTFGLRQH
jgi:hypothetical protein